MTLLPTVPDNIKPTALSRFEQVITTRPPVLETLLLHLPTSSILDLCHTSRYLRCFLKSYPLAWKNLSFRVLHVQLPQVQVTDSGIESPGGSESRKPYALDLFLKFALPATQCLARLELDNTSVSGTELHASVLNPQRSTLIHLSVRGCKDVSIKYHIIPWLHMQMSTPQELFSHEPFALKSLYTYRCRHHRRRPYLPSSLSRRDSDSQPTHQLIEMCHHLGIYTDTAWCPTPSGRCYRRKDYFLGRSGAGAGEVWVPFDRLWRSQNIVGSASYAVDKRRTEQSTMDQGIGRLWEDDESGYGGEALGSSEFSVGEGKEAAVHLRASHRTFVEDFSCHACGDKILERCEQCSVRMHCIGCRKTLCHSCAFDRPIQKKGRRNPSTTGQMTMSMVMGTANTETTHGRYRSKKHEQQKRKDRFWWAPGAIRSPNLMKEETQEEVDSSETEDEAAPTQGAQLQAMSHNFIFPPRLELNWCCLKPSFSGGGGIGFLGTPCGDNVRAAPLPQGRGFEDPSFPTLLKVDSSDASSQSDSSDDSFTVDDSGHTNTPEDSMLLRDNAELSLIPYLEQPQDPNDPSSRRYAAPRNLCKDCYASTNWKVPCADCHYPICIEHDLKGLKVRQCGMRRLARERTIVQECNLRADQGRKIPIDIAVENAMFFFAKWKPIVAEMAAIDRSRRLLGKWAPEIRETPKRLATVRREGVDKVRSGHRAVTQPGRPELAVARWADQEATRSHVLSEEASMRSRPHGDMPLSSYMLGRRHAIRQSKNRSQRARSLSSMPYLKPRFTFEPEVPTSNETPSTSSLTRTHLNINGNLPGHSSAQPAQTLPNSFQPDPSQPQAQSQVHLQAHLRAQIHPQSQAPTSKPTHTQPTTTPRPKRTSLFHGCARLLCPSPRKPGDTRPSCPAQNTALYCSSCQILVCESCRLQNPACGCKNCTERFLCPNCTDGEGVRGRCSWEAEERERMEREGMGEKEAWGEEFWRSVEENVASMVA